MTFIENYPNDLKNYPRTYVYPKFSMHFAKIPPCKSAYLSKKVKIFLKTLGNQKSLLLLHPAYKDRVVH